MKKCNGLIIKQTQTGCKEINRPEMKQTLTVTCQPDTILCQSFMTQHSSTVQGGPKMHRF